MNKKHLILVIGGIVLLMIAIPLFVSAKALAPEQDCARLIAEDGRGVTICLDVLETSTPPTGVPPTDTPVPDTPVPDTPVPPSETPDPEHDSEAWHPPTTHNHFADPSELDDIFGPVGSLYGGQEISYPHQTFRPPGGPGDMENVIKHEGYKWETRRDKGCSEKQFASHNCIPAFRIELHNLGGGGAVTTRIHSYWLEAQICTPDLSECGIYKTGGWMDTGILTVPYLGEYIPLPGDPPDPNTPPDIGGSPYRSYESSFPRQDNRLDTLWCINNDYGYMQNGLNFCFTSRDQFVWVDLSVDPFEVRTVCPDGDCPFNHTTHMTYSMFIDIPKAWDEDGDGFVDKSGNTDRFGNVVPDCSPLGMDCVPFELVHVPIERASIYILVNSMGPEHEFDTAPITGPQPEWWMHERDWEVKFPN